MSGVDLDELDQKILKALQIDGRLTNVELADKVGLSPSPCLARTRRLEKEGIIDHYAALLDAERLGLFVSVFIRITLAQQSESVLEVFERTVQAMPEVMECYLMSGDSDYLLRVVVKDTVTLRNFILDKLTKTPGVANIRSSFALKQVKYKTAYPLTELWRERFDAPDKARKKSQVDASRAIEES